MAKSLLFALLFCTHSFVFPPIFATNGAGHPESKTLSQEVCEAPVPDSFRVASIGGTFIALAWHPAWLGATHELSVSEKDEFGGWTAQYIFPDVPGSFFTVENLESGKEYRFRIATKCPSGDPSELTADVDEHTAIIELSVAGRNPKDPREVNCAGIQYQSYNWLGFKVSGEGATSIFEVLVNDITNIPFAYIERVKTVSPKIVAVDGNGDYPTDFLPNIPNVDIPFQLVRLNTNNPTQESIGYVNYVEHSTIPPTIDLCAVLDDASKPWRNGYTFTVLTAKETIIIPPGGGHGGQGFGQDPSFDRFEVQNPFTNKLCVFIPQAYSTSDKVVMRLVDVNGQVIVNQAFEHLASQVLFPLEWVSSGIYFLQIETENFTQTLKVIKSE